MSPAYTIPASFQWEAFFIYINGPITGYCPHMELLFKCWRGLNAKENPALQGQTQLNYGPEEEGPLQEGPLHPRVFLLHVCLLLLCISHSLSPTLPFPSFWLLFNPTDDGTPRNSQVLTLGV